VSSYSRSHSLIYEPEIVAKSFTLIDQWSKRVIAVFNNYLGAADAGASIEASRTQLGSGMELEAWLELPSLPSAYPPQLSLRLTATYTMQRWIVLALLACSTAGVVVSDPFSVAQRDQPEADRKVLSKVASTYPELARRTNLHGVVKLVVVVAPDGKVTSTEVVGGNPVLVQAAVDAVRKWSTR